MAAAAQTCRGAACPRPASEDEEKTHTGKTMIAHGFDTLRMESQHDATRTWSRPGPRGLASRDEFRHVGQSWRCLPGLPFSLLQRESRQMHVCSWPAGRLCGSRRRPSDPRHRRRSGRRAARWRDRRRRLPEPSLRSPPRADGRFEIAADTPGLRRVTVTLAGFQSSDADDRRVGTRRGERRGRRAADHAPAACPGETVSVTATRGSERLEGAAPVSVVTHRRPAARGVAGARRCAAERAGVQPVSADVVPHGEPDGAGGIAARAVGLRCEPCAGARGRRAAQRPVRRVGVLGPRAAGGD